MRPPCTSLRSSGMNSALLSSAASPLIVVDHYPTGDGQWESQVQAVDVHSCGGRNLSYSSSATEARFTAPWQDVYSQCAQSHPHFVYLEACQQANKAPQVVSLPPQWPSISVNTASPAIRPLDASAYQSYIANFATPRTIEQRNVEGITGAAIKTTPQFSNSVSRESESTARTVTVSEKVCDLDIEVNRVIPARVNIAYQLNYEGGQLPRPDEKVTNVVIRNSEALGTGVPDDLAKLISSSLPAPAVSAN